MCGGEVCSDKGHDLPQYPPAEHEEGEREERCHRKLVSVYRSLAHVILSCKGGSYTTHRDIFDYFLYV